MSKEIRNRIFNLSENSLGSLYWTQPLINSSFLFYASDTTNLHSKVVSTHLPNQVTGSSDYLTVTGTGLNARYRTPNTAPYKAADLDNVFWKQDVPQTESTCDGNRLIAWDFPHLWIKFLNVAPFTILAIAIPKPGVVMTNGIRDALDLSIWWSGTLSFHGKSKQNRSDAQAVWVPEAVPPAIPTGLALSLISGGIKIDWTDNSGGLAQTEIWAKNDSGTYALAYTIATGIVTKSETISPVDLRYIKIRAKNGSLYSDYTAEQSIAMLGSELVTNGINFTDSNSDGVANNWVCYGSGYTTPSIITDTYKAQRATSVGSQTWYTNAIWQVMTFSSGKSYRIDFYAQAGADDALDLRLGPNGGDMWQGSTLTANTWAHFTYIYAFNPAKSNNQLHFGHYNGATAGAWIQVAQVSVKEVLMP